MFSVGMHSYMANYRFFFKSSFLVLVIFFFIPKIFNLNIQLHCPFNLIKSYSCVSPCACVSVCLCFCVCTYTVLHLQITIDLCLIFIDIIIGVIIIIISTKNRLHQFCFVLFFHLIF